SRSPARIAARSIASWKRSDSARLAVRRPALTITCAGMSRQDTTISSAMAGSAGLSEKVVQAAVAGRPVLVGETQARRRRLGLLLEARIGVLGEIDQLLVVAEVQRQQVGMPIQAQALDDQRLEMAHQVVGQVEARGVR